MLVSMFAHILVPLIALVTVAVIQFDKASPVPVQVAEGGTDLCILVSCFEPRLPGQECPRHMVRYDTFSFGKGRIVWSAVFD